MCNRRDLLKIRYIVLWVSNALNVHHFGLVIDRSLKVLGVVALDELCGHTKPRQEDLKLVVCSSVEVRCRDDVVAELAECCYNHELGCLARGGGQGGNTAFEGRDTLFEDIDCRLEIESESEKGQVGIRRALLTFMIRL
jgi:hypothetical protein